MVLTVTHKWDYKLKNQEEYKKLTISWYKVDLNEIYEIFRFVWWYKRR